MSNKIRQWLDTLTDGWELYAILLMALIAVVVGAWHAVKSHDRQIAYVAMREELARCANDCAGHRAGYAWAEAHDVMSVDDCAGKSLSFINGCRSYVYDQIEMDRDPPDPPSY